MTRRSESVKNAINRYNEQALLLDPPAQTVTWQDIANYTHVGEFEMLRIARWDIRREKWVQKPYRDAGIKYFKLCRAREELQRLNVEVRRLLTWIHDENEHTQQVINHVVSDEPHLADELRRRWAMQSAVNQVHLEQLKLLQREEYYTGPRDCGEAAGPLGATENDQASAEIQQNKDFEAVAEYMAHVND